MNLPGVLVTVAVAVAVAATATATATEPPPSQQARALYEDGDDDAAIREARRALALTPDDPALHTVLAQSLYRNEEYNAAYRAATDALRLHATGTDEAAARQVLHDTRFKRIRERIDFHAGVSIRFDSNILSQAIAGHFTRASAATQADVPPRIIPEGDFHDPQPYRNLVSGDARNLPPPQTQWGFFLEPELDLEGKLVDTPRLALYAEYNFDQDILLTSQGSPVAFVPDVLHFQEHTLTLRLTAQPTPWLKLLGRLEGFANFNGLAHFTPFQGGLKTEAGATFLEGARATTSLSYRFQYRASFNRALDSNLDGDKHLVRIAQGLRLGPLLSELGYLFTADLTGALRIQVPLRASPPPRGVQIGLYTYLAPLSYLGNQVFLKESLPLPRGFKLGLILGYEHQQYLSPYQLSYAGQTLKLPSGQTTLALPSFLLSSTARLDDRVTLEASAMKTLPRGFQLGLRYNLLDILSTIVNVVDNRNLVQHVIQLALEYDR